MRLTLPWPPSTNTYWRHVGSRTLLSKAGREYKRAVRGAVLEQLGAPVPALSGAVCLSVELYPPDRRRRDIDNHAGKALLDAIADAGLLGDDSQVRELHAVMLGPAPGGRCEVEIQTL